MCNKDSTDGLEWHGRILTDGRPAYLCQRCLSTVYWSNHMGEPGCPYGPASGSTLPDPPISH